MIKTRNLQLFFDIFVIASILSAQDGEKRPVIGANNAGIGFRQEFNTYLWSANVALDQQLAKQWHFSLNENLRTSMLRIGSEGDRWKDDQEFGLRLSYNVLPAVTLQTQMQSVIFQDKQSGFNNDVQSHFGTVGFVYTPVPKLYSTFHIGPKWDSRYSQSDRGPTFDLSLRGSGLEWEGYDSNIAFALTEDRFDRRVNSNLLANYRVNKQFTANAADSLDIYFTNQRRDNYVSIQGDIESQRENIKGFRNTLFYHLSETVDVNLKTFLEFKNVELLQYGELAKDRRRKRNDQRMSNDMLISINKNKIRGRFNLLYTLQEQRYDFTVDGRPFSERTAFVTPDNASSRLMGVAHVESRNVQRDSAAAYFSVSKYQYDTPDTTNFDDRDELRINTRASFSHRFNPSLRMELLASVNLYHMVYIFGERSADNNWNRIFLLRPIIEFQPVETFRLHQSFEVLANYVDYDFEDANVQTRSFVFRKFAMTDSLQWRLLPRTCLLFDYRLQLEENGQLFWSRWAQNLLANRTKQWFHFSFKYRIQKHFYLTPGYSMYIRDEWRRNTAAGRTQELAKVGTYISRGPTLNVHYVARNLRIFLEATRFRVSVAGQEDYYINNIDLGLNWIF